MQHITNKQLVGIILILILFGITLTPQYKIISSIPDKMNFTVGEEQHINLGLPLSITVISDKNGVLQINSGNESNNNFVLDLKKPIYIRTLNEGEVNLKFKIFGIIPLKEVAIEVLPKVEVIPGGIPIGVKLNTKGSIVVSISDVIGMDGKIYRPAKDAGIVEGDVILAVNDIEIKQAEDITDIINKENGEQVTLKINRKGQVLYIPVKPVKSQEGLYRLGLWVRDQTAGVGTLTFIIPDKRIYGALGHAITDIDTGRILDVYEGEIFDAKIVSVNHGMRGKPGEIKAIFLNDESRLGNIEKNTAFGIYGILYKDIEKNFGNALIPVALQSQIKEGPAQLLTTIDDNGIQAFNIEIQKVIRQNKPGSKSLIIKVTDPRLINKTGGIVQGMSGSPIIQDNKLVGAVTHVFINDPTKGYGVFAEWMLKEAGIEISDYDIDKVVNQ